MDYSAAIAEIQQERSRFQLEHFVLGQHDTPEMRFYQLCIEMQDVEFKLAHATLTVRRDEIEVDRLRASGEALDAVDADIKQLELEQTKLAMIGATRELDVLRSMFDAHRKYTRAEIEHAQPDYWRSRLTRQTQLQELGARHGVGWAQLDAMRQAGIELAHPEPSSVDALPPART